MFEKLLSYVVNPLESLKYNTFFKLFFNYLKRDLKKNKVEMKDGFS